ncbi:hypothetical protein EHM69_07020 [candidate division KSB1 bacterium]|nr:MAG: hypothetical protein EHM69_07020 [candidate division KSB1 bacterium]
MTDDSCRPNKKRIDGCGAFGGIYGFAFIGAAVYYIQHSAGFWEGVLGVLKAIVWPAFVLYKVFEMLKM